jgi:hypothetical protein
MAPSVRTEDGRLVRAARVTLIVVVILGVMACSVGGFVISRNVTQQQSSGFGTQGVDTSQAAITVSAFITRIDTRNQVITVEVDEVNVEGTLAGSDGTPAEDITLYSNSRRDPVIKLAKGEVFTTRVLEMPLSGTITDFPFDGYSAPVSLQAVRDSDNGNIPMTVYFTNVDAFFAASPTVEDAGPAGLAVQFGFDRSVPTLVFGVFVIVLMLGLASSAALLAYYVIRTRQGMAFSAYSVMGALLFAMVPLRNATPGDPPIGSLIDFAGFFIAELVISVSLVASVVIGYRHQTKIDAGLQ